MLRLVVNKARHHYNVALEHAERGRLIEAIDELKNCLDLDKRFCPAHVVLGTLLAKRGDYEGARASWEAALALQPDLQKAHNYLTKVETISQSIPALRRLRLWSWSASAATAVCLAGLFYFVRTLPQPGALRQAQAAFTKKDYATTLRHLAEAESVLDRTGMVNVASDAIRQAIAVELNQEVEKIRQLKYKERFDDALALIGDLERRGIDPTTSVSLAAERRDIAHYFRSKVETLYDRYTSGSIPLETLADQLQAYLRVYPDVPERSQLTAILDKAREQEAGRSFKELEKTMKSLPPSKVLTEVRKIAQRFPGSPAVTQGRIVIVESLLRNRFDDFRAALDRKKFGQAESILSELRDLRDEFKGAVEVDGALTLATNLLMREEREDRIRTAEQLVRRGEFVDATNMATDLLDEPDVSPAEREVAYRLLASIERKSMQMDISKYRESVDRYLQRKVATDESSRTLNRIEYILAAAEGDRSTTPILTKSDLAVLLGIAAVSAEVLKNDALRDDYLERLVKLEGDKGKTVAAVRKKPAPATVATPTPRPATNQRPQATATPKPRKPAARQTPTP